MEHSRDATVKCLNTKRASITDPAADLLDDDRDEGDNSRGKTSLLAYLLSWQLILQIFQSSSLDKRAKLANFLHGNKHVEDLMTCLFCVMPKLMEVGQHQSKGMCHE